jgi:hypothetical protein
MPISKTTTAWERVGHVIYWGSVLVGSVLGAYFAYAVAPLGMRWQIVFGGGVFLVCYLCGRAFRFLLAGR